MAAENNTLLNSALSLAAAGIYVFPLKPGQKTPAFNGWQAISTTDAETIKALWAQNPGFNVAIDAGKSGLTIFDYDCKNGAPGLLTREAWQAAHRMPETVTAITPTGGKHELYRGAAKTSTNSQLGVDVRGKGGYIVAPPSVIDGKCYRWEKPPVIYPIADTESAVNEFLSVVQGKAPGERKAPYKAPETVTEGGRVNAMIQLAGSLIGKGLTPAAAEAAIKEENALRCDPPLTDEELEREVFPALQREKWQENTHPYNRDIVLDAGLLDRLRALDPAEGKKYGLHDAGSALLFMDLCGDCCRFAEDRRKWVFYDGCRWNFESGENLVKEKMKALANALVMYAIQIQDESKREKYLKYAAKWQQWNTRKTIMKDAESVRPCKSTDFDNNPYLLNCENGTLDLKSLAFREHRAEDMLSRLANVKYNPAAASPRWLSFINEITSNDTERARYIQKILGYSLTGLTKFEEFYIFLGLTSRNGKSTLLETFSCMMGEYAGQLKAESLAKQARANGNNATPDIACLVGKRLVIVPEPPFSLELNSSFIKSITGRDTITARNLNEGFFSYVPTYKIIFNSNHRPRIDDTTVFQSDRVKLVPFTERFTERRQDPDLKEKFRKPENLSAVLNWALSGWQALQAEGFKMPESVAQATEDYKEKSDKLGRFLDEKTESGDGLEVPLMAFHSAFSLWCSSNGLQPVGVPALREMLETKSYFCKRKRPTGTGRNGKVMVFVLGLQLLPESTEK